VEAPGEPPVAAGEPPVAVGCPPVPFTAPPLPPEDAPPVLDPPVPGVPVEPPPPVAPPVAASPPVRREAQAPRTETTARTERPVMIDAGRGRCGATFSTLQASCFRAGGSTRAAFWAALDGGSSNEFDVRKMLPSLRS
jgi:hypothetical protein